VFRRRRREDADHAGAGYPGADATGDADAGWADPDETGEWDDDAAEPAGAHPVGADQAGAGPVGADPAGADPAGADPGGAGPSAPVPPGLRGGPWDADEAYPERERADFGSLLFPVTPMQQIELATDGQRFVWVTVKDGMSELRVHAFAAPRSGELWPEVQQEIIEELSTAGTAAQETEGPFGTEVFAHVPVEPGNASAGTRPVRFIGIDGPRWLLRGLIIGGAATGAEPVEPFEELLSDIVVVRGDHPMPPRDMLELRLPPEVQQAFEQQQQAFEQQQQAGGLGQQQAGGEVAEPEEENRFRTDLSPFERGPEFTETR
jgi:hypothetical protein